MTPKAPVDWPLPPEIQKIWTFGVPAVPPNQNRILRQHWRERREEKRRWWMLIHNALVASPIPKAIGRRRITITVWTAGNLQDEDNLKAATKEVLVDNLRPSRGVTCTYRKGPQKGKSYQMMWIGHGLILDDNRQWLEWGPVEAIQVESRDLERTVVVLEDLAEPTTEEQRRDEVYQYVMDARTAINGLLSAKNAEALGHAQGYAQAVLDFLPADLAAWRAGREG